MNDRTTTEPARLADEAAEAVRALVHATQLAKKALLYPGDVYDVLGSLSALVDRLPQTCRQLGRFLEHEMQAGRVAATHGAWAGDAFGAVASAADWLDQAGVLAEDLRGALSSAQIACAGLAHAGDDEKDGDG